MTGLLIEISSPDLSVDPRFRAMNLYVKQLNKNFIMSFNVNNLPLAPRSRQRTRAPAEVKKRCSGGYHTQLLKGTRKMNWWLISSTRTVFFSYEIGWYSIGVHISRLYCSFKSFHAFYQHLKIFFCRHIIFQIIPYPSPLQNRQSTPCLMFRA